VRSNANLFFTLCLLSTWVASAAFGQSNQEWIAYKQKCNIAPGMAYNDWVAAGSQCNSGSTTSGTGTAVGGLTGQQQMAMQAAQLGGYMIGQGLHNILFGQPRPVTAPLDPAAQQRALAVEQLNNSGIYLLRKNDYAGAINEFQQALNQSPNNANILFNLQLAREGQKNAANAAKTSNALGNLLGTPQGIASDSPSGVRNPLNLVNLDSSVVDFRGMGHNSSANPNSSFLNTVITGSDSNTVDLGNAHKNYVDPKLLEGQINSVLRHPVSAAAQMPPQEQINKLFQSPQPPSGSAVHEADLGHQTKTKVQEIFSNSADSPAGPHN
jgi:tetratricopeptide (TPR) repeat protein